MRQWLVVTQPRHKCRRFQSESRAERKRCQCIRDVVPASELQFRHWQQRFITTHRQSTEICPEHDRAVMFRVNAAAGVARPLQPFCGTSGLARYDICRARVSRALLLFLPEQERGRDDSGQASRLGFRAGAFSLAHRVGRTRESPTAFRPWGEVSHAASRSSSVPTLAVPASSLSRSSWLSSWRCRVSRSSSRPSCSNGRQKRGWG